MDGYYNSAVSCSHLNGLKKELGGLFTVVEETPLSFRLKVDKPFCLGLILAYIFNRWHKDGVSFDLLQVSMKENTLFLQICRDAGLNHMNVECV
ncbi:MAG: hypothetical protein J5797_02860 [Prevotella sp.]|nr:hypothetical protein [Prevotella sp.]MBO4463117.1 hypothetical protein [Prevotella sp.]